MNARSKLLASFAIFALCSVATVHAQLVWRSTGADNGTNRNMNSAANWGDGSTAPDGQDLSFGASTILDPRITSDLSVNSLTFTSNNTYTIGQTGNSTLTIGAGGLTDAAADVYFSGNLNLSATQTWDIDGAVTVSNTLSGASTATLIKEGAGTLTLTSNSNSYSGGTEILDGLLQASSNSALGTGFVTLGSSATLQIDAVNPTIGSLSDQAGEGNTDTIKLSTNVGTLHINQTSYGEFRGSITGYSGASAAVLDKTGSGALVLSGANAYTGGTTVNGGTLVAANNSALGSNSVAVNPTGSLLLESGVTIANSVSFGGGAHTTDVPVIGGLGTLAPTSGTISVGNKGAFSPGDKGNAFGGPPVGTLYMTANVTFGNNGIYNWGIQDGNGSDLIAITGGLTFSNTQPFVVSLYTFGSSGAAGTLSLSTFNPNQNYQWEILSTTNGIAGFSAAPISIDSSNFLNSLNGGSFSVTQGGNNLYLNFTAVPEPSTWALLLGGLGLAGIVARRRRA